MKIRNLLIIYFFIFPLKSFADGQQVLKIAKPLVVFINGVTGNGMAISGSGVIVASNEILTNCHVVENVKNLKVRYSDKQEVDGLLKGKVANLDLCAIQADTGTRNKASVISLSEVKEGQSIYAIGNPLSLNATISNGIISGLRQTENGKLIQITAPISHGSSGGGLFDGKGRLIGITTFTLTKGQNLNFAIPADYRNSLGISTYDPQTAPESNQNKGQELTFKGVPLGASVEEFSKNFPNATCKHDEVLDDDIKCEGQTIFYLGEYSSKYLAHFSNNSLWLVTVRFLGNDRKALSLKLRNKVQEYFGKPPSDELENENDFTSKFGASAVWKFDEHQFLSVIRCGDRLLILGGCVTDGAEVQLRGSIKRKSDF